MTRREPTSYQSRHVTRDGLDRYGHRGAGIVPEPRTLRPESRSSRSFYPVRAIIEGKPSEDVMRTRREPAPSPANCESPLYGAGGVEDLAFRRKSRLRDGWPAQLILTGPNSRCSTGFHFDAPVGNDRSWRAARSGRPPGPEEQPSEAEDGGRCRRRPGVPSETQTPLVDSDRACRKTSLNGYPSSCW